MSPVLIGEGEEGGEGKAEEVEVAHVDPPEARLPGGAEAPQSLLKGRY